MFEENSKAYSLEGTGSIFEELNSASVILAQVRALAGTPSKGESAAVPAREPQGAARTVNINLGGRQTRVNVASGADADALTGVLRHLESASRSAQ